MQSDRCCLPTHREHRLLHAASKGEGGVRGTRRNRSPASMSSSAVPNSGDATPVSTPAWILRSGK
jgi:hypothetical protein